MRLFITVALALVALAPVRAADTATPIAPKDLVFAEKGGLVAVEAEHFTSQSKTDKRAFHITSSTHTPKADPDGDPSHADTAGGGAYVEALPDTRRTHDDKLVKGENFSDEPGAVAVLTYRVHFQTTGRYYVWVRAYSTGTEDNGIHVGLDGKWPESGRRMQWSDGKNSWRWDSKQRTAEVHTGVPGQICLDIDKAGVHEIQFSMREDGFEFDRWLMTTDKDFKRPEDVGPASVGHEGKLPEPFPVSVLEKKDKPRQPNVLFIISDDLSCDLGCYGNKGVLSPNLDSLAKSGVRFDRGYVQYTVCNPSRASFLTGLRPTTTKILDNTTHFRKPLPDVVTLPQLFRENGYETVGLGKIFHRGLSPDDVKQEMDDPKSFDRVAYGKATALGNKGEGRNLTGDKLAWCRWLAAEGTDADQPDGQLADDAVTTLAQKRDKPLFLAVGFYRPHDPFVVPKRYFEMYDREKLALPVTPDGYTPPFPHTIGGGAFKTAFDQITDKERREFLHSYYAGVSFMDAQVGKLLDALKANNLHENTVVVFIGDHGYELGFRGWWNKNTLFERSCRTPLIIRDPMAKGNGTSTSTITEFVDLYPTLAARCGLKDVPKNLEGTDFHKVLDDPAAKHKEAAVTVVQRGKFLGRSIRTDRYRYTEWDGGEKGTELYDHTTDPGEWKNLADDPKAVDIKADLKKQIEAISPIRSAK